jgi:hypothetical protein
MARIPLVTRDQIGEKEKPAYDAFMLSRANRPNIGPYSLLLHMPEMAQRLEALRTYLRDEASLTQKLQELVNDPDESDRLLCGAGVQHEQLRAGSPRASDGNPLDDVEGQRLWRGIHDHDQ